MSLSSPKILRGAAFMAVVAFTVLPAVAQDEDEMTSAQKMRAEISEAMEAIAAFSEQESAQALNETRVALDQLDAEIQQREQALREDWADMSADARKTASARLRDLREARNRLGERFGALQSGTSLAWDELQGGFSDAWTAFSDAWGATEKEAPAD
jgi:hypothetical protein